MQAFFTRKPNNSGAEMCVSHFQQLVNHILTSHSTRLIRNSEKEIILSQKIEIPCHNNASAKESVIQLNSFEFNLYALTEDIPFIQHSN